MNQTKIFIRFLAVTNSPMFDRFLQWDMQRFTQICVSFFQDDQIQAEYRIRALKYHPDKNPDNPVASLFFNQYWLDDLIRFLS